MYQKRFSEDYPLASEHLIYVKWDEGFRNEAIKLNEKFQDSNVASPSMKQRVKAFVDSMEIQLCELGMTFSLAKGPPEVMLQNEIKEGLIKARWSLDLARLQSQCRWAADRDTAIA